MKRQRMYGGKEKMIVRERTERRAIRTHQYGREIKKNVAAKSVSERESAVDVETRRTGEMNRVKWCGTHTHTGAGMRERRTGKRKSR